MSALLPGREQSFMHAESQRSVERHLAKLVKNGLLPKSALAAVREESGRDNVPTSHRGRNEYYYEHVPSIFPAPKSSMASNLTLGIGPVSMGRASCCLNGSEALQRPKNEEWSSSRWDVDGASIFSVEDGKRLAQLPVREPTHFERVRAERIARSQMETPTLRGMRLLPVFSPGRAFFWGSVLALWGSAAFVMSLGRTFGIKRPEDTSQVMTEILGPWSGAIKQQLQPLRERVQARAAAVNGVTADRSVFLDKMRSQLR